MAGCVSVCFVYVIMVESGLDDSDNLGHLGHFLEGQVGLIWKLNYLDVTQISHVFRKQCWHLVSERTLGIMNALKYHWCETNLLSQGVLKHVVSKDFIFMKSVQGTASLSCQE